MDVSSFKLYTFTRKGITKVKSKGYIFTRKFFYLFCLALIYIYPSKKMDLFSPAFLWKTGIMPSLAAVASASAVQKTAKVAPHAKHGAIRLES
ncbi:hypothetical protein EU421_22120 [Salmonella enterica subsp. enterica serovar Nigeria]|nr:hypothetical protein [Salmonella enterica subsp. enterica serovar Nigeria]